MPRFLGEFTRRATSFALVAATAASPHAAVAAGHEYVVAMANMAYGPMPTGLRVGDTIVFVNKDSVPHTVTARDHSFDLRIGPGQRERLNLREPGTYQIYCILHAPMRGSFTVAS